MEAIDERVSPMHIEILGFPGCPMTPEIERSVRAACKAVAGDALITSIDLSQLEGADSRLRWAAPTVLIDGIDLFGAAPAAHPGLACRVYAGGLPDAAAVLLRVSARANR